MTVTKQKTIIILGGGSGGLVAANELRKKVGKDARIVLIDKSKTHIYAPAFLYLMLGKRQAEKIQKPFSLLKRKGIEYINDELTKIDPEKKTVKTQYENVFAIGDGAAVTLVSGKPLSKAGVFAHFEAEVVVENIVSEIKGVPARKEYDGRAFCFLELGFGKAGFADGNFYAEPKPVVKMKRPGRLWHWGKILFEKYWLWKWF